MPATFPQHPRVRLRKPSIAKIAAFREANASAPFAYAAVGQTHLDVSRAPARYQLDHNRHLLGHGDIVWRRACDALRDWRMFPSAWATIAPTDAPIVPGLTLTMLARGYGCWWLNACRIVYVIDTTSTNDRMRRFGFAYGTLPAHVEEGEERFLIEMLDDGSVWYDLRAFSRPRFWPVRLATPLARRLQHRFIRASQQALHSAVHTRAA